MVDQAAELARLRAALADAELQAATLRSDRDDYARKLAQLREAHALAFQANQHAQEALRATWAELQAVRFQYRAASQEQARLGRQLAELQELHAELREQAGQRLDELKP